MAPPSSPNISPPLSPITTLRISPSKLLLTPKSSPPLLTFYRMETKEISERYVAPCFINGDDWVDILEGIDFGDIQEIEGIELSPYVVRWERVQEIRKSHLEEVKANEEMVKEYKAIKEKSNLGAFVLPIRLEGRYDTHALADNGSNINIVPYRIFEKLGREQVKSLCHNVSMLNHYEVEPIRMLKDVLCRVGVTTVLARFLDLNMPVDRTIPIIVERSFLHTCGGIINTLKGTTLTFDGVCHQKFYVAEIQIDNEESDSDDDEEYYLKRDEIGKPFYGPNL
nr:hypothetical protein [Tanacetum cinerariifolium]